MAKQFFGEGRLGKGKHVNAPTCVMNGMCENYKLEEGKTTGVLAVCKEEEYWRRVLCQKNQCDQS